MRLFGIAGWGAVDDSQAVGKFGRSHFQSNGAGFKRRGGWWESTGCFMRLTFCSARRGECVGGGGEMSQPLVWINASGCFSINVHS